MIGSPNPGRRSRNVSPIGDVKLSSGRWAIWSARWSSAWSIGDRSWSRATTYTTAEAITTASATATAEESAMRARKLIVRRSRVAQGVADAADRVDQARSAAVLGLAPQVADVDVQGVRRRPEV